MNEKAAETAQNANNTNEKVKSGDVNSNPIGRELDLFVKQIDSLADTLPEAIGVIQKVNLSSMRDFADFLANECTAKPGDGGKTEYRMNVGKYLKYRRLQGRFQKAQLAQQIVPRTFLVSLVSQFDAFLGRLIKQLFNLKPEALDVAEGTLTFSQLVEFGSIENAKDYVVEKEIESVLRRSHAEQFDWLENKFGLKLRVNLHAWPVFIELTERRNLFVHSNGLVSRQYLNVCKRHGSALEPDARLGKSLGVTREYFETAHECLFEIGVKLAQVLWRKLTPDDLDGADQNLLGVGYELLDEARYRLARCLLDFSTETLKRHGKEDVRLSMVVNRAQAYKWSGDDDSATRIISEVDWSATAPKFQLAQAVILNQFDKALQIMTNLGKSDAHLMKMAYREWPLFKELRKVPGFSRTFEEIFGEPLNTVTVDTPPLATESTGIVQ